jgi:hypothetical protein
MCAPGDLRRPLKACAWLDCRPTGMTQAKQFWMRLDAANWRRIIPFTSFRSLSMRAYHLGRRAIRLYRFAYS